MSPGTGGPGEGGLSFGMWDESAGCVADGGWVARGTWDEFAGTGRSFAAAGIRMSSGTGACCAQAAAKARRPGGREIADRGPDAVVRRGGRGMSVAYQPSYSPD